MVNNDNIYLLTSPYCDNHLEVYAENEEKMLDWEGKIVSQRERHRIVLKDVVGSIQRGNKIKISNLEKRIIADVFETVKTEKITSHTFEDVPQECDHDGSIIHNVSSILNNQTFLQRLMERAELGSFCMNIGATSVNDSPFLSISQVDDDDRSSFNSLKCVSFF